MGVGYPDEIEQYARMGVDMMDCVLPTRAARHALLFTSEGRLNIKNKQYAEDQSPPDPACQCPVCRRYSRAYLRHLMQCRRTALGNAEHDPQPRVLSRHHAARARKASTQCQPSPDRGFEPAACALAALSASPSVISALNHKIAPVPSAVEPCIASVVNKNTLAAAHATSTAARQVMHPIPEQPRQWKHVQSYNRRNRRHHVRINLQARKRKRHHCHCRPLNNVDPFERARSSFGSSASRGKPFARRNSVNALTQSTTAPHTTIVTGTALSRSFA